MSRIQGKRSLAVDRSRRRGALLCGLNAVLLTSTLLASNVSLAQDVPEPGFPTYEQVEEVIDGHFKSVKGYKAGDVLSQRDVKPLLAALEELGWTVAGQDKILAKILSDGDDMVRQLRRRKGISFMRKIGNIPEGYDRLDRLRKMPRGKYRLRELINDPGGYTMIQYMATTKGGRNLGKQLSKGKNGRGFNKPTGKIYNEKQLSERLKKSYDAEVKARADEAKPST